MSSGRQRDMHAGARAAEPRRRPCRNRVFRADNLELMRTLDDECCDLIYIDPPFNAHRRAEQTEAPESACTHHNEGRPLSYLAFMRPRIIEMRRLLSPQGSLYVHLDFRTVHYVKVMLDEIFGADHFLNEIIWSYRSGGRTGRWFARKHDTILLYARQLGSQTFNRLRCGTYRTLGLRLTPDGRPYKSTRKGPLHFHPDGPTMPDVWDIPFLSTVSKERTGYPAQKPETLLDRIVRASSNEGDIVADFFCGSGTALVVAKRLNRHWLGCDISAAAVGLTRRRLARLTGAEYWGQSAFSH